MRKNNWLLLGGLFVALLVLPPIPGYLINQLEMATGAIEIRPGIPLWETMLNPLRLIGTLMAIAWVWAMANLRAGTHGYVRYVGTFVIAGVFYVVPVWVGVFGSNTGWGELWWLLGTASWYEWMQLHAPVAGALSLWAMHLLRTAPRIEERQGPLQRLVRHLRPGRQT